MFRRGVDGGDGHQKNDGCLNVVPRRVGRGDAGLGVTSQRGTRPGSLVFRPVFWRGSSCLLAWEEGGGEVGVEKGGGLAHEIPASLRVWKSLTVC